MNASDEKVFNPASPLDFWELTIVTWIRLVASTVRGFAVLATPRPEPAKSEPDKERTLAEEEELLLHVLE